MIEKDYTISFIRMFSMFLIITCHILQYYGNSWMSVLNVGVQIFLIISGYLYGGKETGNVFLFLKRNFVKILLPYWIFLLIACLLYYIFFPSYLNLKNVVLSFMTLDVIKGIGHLWFIRYILLCYCFVPILNIIRRKLSTSNLLLIWLSTMILVELIGISTKIFTGVYVNCFVFGYFSRNLDIRKSKFSRLSLIVLNVLIYSLALFSNILKILVKNEYFLIESTYVSNLLDTYSHLLFGAALFLLIHQILKIRTNGVLINFSDKYSYHIYLVHQFFILSPFSVLNVPNAKLLNIILVYVVCALAGVLLYRLCKCFQNMMNRFHLSLL